MEFPGFVNLHRCSNRSCFGYLWKFDPPAEVSFSLHEDTLRMLLKFTTKANERKRRQTSTKNHRKNFGAVKKTREQIFTFGFRSILRPLHDEICPASRKCFSLLAALSPFYREISNILPFSQCSQETSKQAHYC